MFGVLDVGSAVQKVRDMASENGVGRKRGEEAAVPCQSAAAALCSSDTRHLSWLASRKGW